MKNKLVIITIMLIMIVMPKIVFGAVEHNYLYDHVKSCTDIDGNKKEPTDLDGYYSKKMCISDETQKIEYAGVECSVGFAPYNLDAAVVNGIVTAVDGYGCRQQVSLNTAPDNDIGYYYTYKEVEKCDDENNGELRNYGYYNVCIPKTSTTPIDETTISCSSGSEKYELELKIEYENEIKDVKGYVCRKKNLFNINVNNNTEDKNCQSLLGNPTCTTGKNCSPAFYLQTIFNVMKYVAIIIVLVMSTIDFFGSVTSQDNDAIKKASSKLIKRLIICVVIFILPSLIKFFLTLLDVYSSTTCGIS